MLPGFDVAVRIQLGLHGGDHAAVQTLVGQVSLDAPLRDEAVGALNGGVDAGVFVTFGQSPYAFSVLQPLWGRLNDGQCLGMVQTIQAGDFPRSCAWPCPRRGDQTV